MKVKPWLMGNLHN